MKGPETGRLNKDGIVIHDLDDFDGMRQSGALAAKILDKIAPEVQPGVRTGELDEFIHELMVDNGARPATLGYRGYPKSSCISINHVVCHGIPGEKIPGRKNDVLQEHDIVNIDVTCILDGWYGDTSRMYVAGKPKKFAERLINVTHESLMLGIAEVKPGNTFNDIGVAIQKFVEMNRMSVVRDFCGHGLGRVFHSAPNVLHYDRRDRSAVLEPGMFFTIEPMVNLGRPETKVLSDNWTAITRDKSLSAQFEHSVGVTEEGVEIFTLSPGNLFHPTWGAEA